MSLSLDKLDELVGKLIECINELEDRLTYLEKATGHSLEGWRKENDKNNN